jgi:urea transporter
LSIFLLLLSPTFECFFVWSWHTLAHQAGQAGLSAIKAKQHAATAHISCGSQAYVLEEAHGICVLAGMLVKFHAAQLMRPIAPYKSLRLTELLPTYHYRRNLRTSAIIRQNPS